jgi:hypothetical protein
MGDRFEKLARDARANEFETRRILLSPKTASRAVGRSHRVSPEAL